MLWLDMLKKCFRLKNKYAFAATYKRKNIVADEYFVFYIGKEKESAEFSTKFGFVVSKKFHKRAVKRNKIKRLAREVIRLILKEDTSEASKILSKHLSVIILPREKALGADFSTVKKSVENIISKIS